MTGNDPTREISVKVLESLVVRGDISQLSPEQKVLYYNTMCQHVGLDPVTQPFSFVTSKGKTVIYANKSCTDQLTRMNQITRTILSRERIGDVFVVTCRASLPNGRHDDSVGVVAIGGLKGDDLANAIMKAESKSKRRATLSICGLGMVDESELETMPIDKAEIPASTPKLITEEEINKTDAPLDITNHVEASAMVSDENDGAPKMATKGQIRAIIDYGNGLGLDVETMQDCLEVVAGRRETAGLTYEQVELWQVQLSKAGNLVKDEGSAVR